MTTTDVDEDTLRRIVREEIAAAMSERLALSSAPASACTCYRPWQAVIPPPPCPIHGQAQMPVVTSSWTTMREPFRNVMAGLDYMRATYGADPVQPADATT